MLSTCAAQADSDMDYAAKVRAEMDKEGGSDNNNKKDEL